MHNALRAYYLHQLGIVEWVSRSPSAPHTNVEGKSLEQLQQQVAACTRCPLHQTRTQTVFARGNPHAKLFVIGEAPGFYEDQQGLPFVGKAGGLLNNMLQSIGLSDDQMYIANVLKCRPPDNRDPRPEEIAHCSHYLREQIAKVNPQLIVAVGRFAGHYVLNASLPLHQMRGKIHQYEGKPVLVSYHPAYLLRNPRDKKKAYADWLQVKNLLAAPA